MPAVKLYVCNGLAEILIYLALYPSRLFESNWKQILYIRTILISQAECVLMYMVLFDQISA